MFLYLKYLQFSIKSHVVDVYYKRLAGEAILIHINNICFYGEISNIITFYHFHSNPRFSLFLLYVRCKSGVTFVRKCFRDTNQIPHSYHLDESTSFLGTPGLFIFDEIQGRRVFTWCIQVCLCHITETSPYKNYPRFAPNI